MKAPASVDKAGESAQDRGLSPSSIHRNPSRATGGPLPRHSLEELDPVRPVLCDPVSDLGSTSVQTRGTTSHQSELWRKQSLWKHQLIDRLLNCGRSDLAESLLECHTEQVHLKCMGCAKPKSFWNRCDRFYCPECQPSLARNRARQIEWWTLKVKEPKHLVLTVRNLPDLTKALVQQFKKCFAKLRRSKLFRPVRGGFYALEVTNEGRGWHLHLHCILDGPFLPQAEIKAAWDLATDGWGYIVDIRDARKGDYKREVTKYAVKGSQLCTWSGEEAAMFIDAFSGVRTFGVFGSCFGQREEYKRDIADQELKLMTCECGCAEWRRVTLGEVLGLVADTPPSQCPTGVAPPQMEFPTIKTPDEALRFSLSSLAALGR